MLLPPPHPLAADDPFFSLVLATPRLVLRPAWDEDITGLVDASEAGIHPDDEMPFSRPWSRGTRPELYRGTAATIWNERASGRGVDDWIISFVVREASADSEWWTAPIIGRQDVWAKEFPLLRWVESGSWLTQSAQGRGIGTEMRLAVLLWAFDHLDALEARSGALMYNEKSLNVSRKAGYELNGQRTHNVEGKRTVEQLVRVNPESLQRPDWTLQEHGTDDVRNALGLNEPAPEPAPAAAPDAEEAVSPAQ